MDERNVALGNVRQHPHGGDIGDGIRGRCIARLDQEAGCRIARRDAARNRARHDQSRIGHAFGHDLVHLPFALAEDPHGVARRPKVTFCGLLIGNRLLQIVLRNRARLVELLEALQIAGGQIQHAGCGDQVRVGREQVGTVDGEQGLALLDFIADFGEQVHDFALIGREHLDGELFVEVDAAHCHPLDRENMFSDRLDLNRGELLVVELNALGGRR
jgi:hypothetical protein